MLASVCPVAHTALCLVIIMNFDDSMKCFFLSQKKKKKQQKRAGKTHMDLKSKKYNMKRNVPA